MPHRAKQKKLDFTSWRRRPRLPSRTRRGARTPLAGQSKRARHGRAIADGAHQGEAADAAEDVDESDNSGHSDIDLESDTDDPVPRWIVEQQESFERALRAQPASASKPMVRPKPGRATASASSGPRITDFAVPDPADDPSVPAGAASGAGARLRTGTERVVQFGEHSIHYYPANQNFVAFCNAHAECRKKRTSKGSVSSLDGCFWRMNTGPKRSIKTMTEPCGLSRI